MKGKGINTHTSSSECVAGGWQTPQQIWRPGHHRTASLMKAPRAPAARAPHLPGAVGDILSSNPWKPLYQKHAAGGTRHAKQCLTFLLPRFLLISLLSRLFLFSLFRSRTPLFFCSAEGVAAGICKIIPRAGEASGNDGITKRACSCCLCLTARCSVRQHGWCVWPRIRTHGGHGARLYLPLRRVLVGGSSPGAPPVHAGIYARQQGPFSRHDGHEEDD